MVSRMFCVTRVPHSFRHHVPARGGLEGNALRWRSPDLRSDRRKDTFVLGKHDRKSVIADLPKGVAEKRNRDKSLLPSDGFDSVGECSCWHRLPFGYATQHHIL